MSDFFLVFSEYGAQWGPRLAQAALITALLSFLGFLVAIILGLLLALMQFSSVLALRKTAQAYVIFFRGVPLLAVLFLIYFGLPGIGIVMSAFQAALVGLGLSFAAQMAEVFRSGLMAIPRGQWEAASAVGMTPLQSFRLIILPQVIRVIRAPIIVTFVSLLKDSSLASLITVNELVLTGRAMATEYFLPLHIYIAVGAFYFIIAFPLSLLAKKMGRRSPVRT